ncbi:MAG: hypothetical protein K8L99_27405 [Anaerolineae bacterium]|nr:hypothetical protein [Anaerolineae bacterium]
MTAASLTALRNTCVLETPSETINQAFLFAKDSIARCMRYYTLGWGMSNAPHRYTIVVGRDTAWMGVGIDYVAPWFVPESLRVFRDRQQPSGKIIEYVDMESGVEDDYGLNMADNTPLYIWAIWHHWQQFQDAAFKREFEPSLRAASDYLLSQMDDDSLLNTIPNGTDVHGISSWRNIIADTVIAGQVTEMNALAVMALRVAAHFTGDERYRTGVERIAAAMDRHLWLGDHFALNRVNGEVNPQLTGDNIFPVLFGSASARQRRKVLERLSHPDFWNARGLRTVPNSDPDYDPQRGFGLVGGSWPNLTLWYATAVAATHPDRALDALERVAQPVVAESSDETNTHQGEFAEYFDGDTGVNLGMHLSPWVAPTFIWALLEGLLGLTWINGIPRFNPHWPQGWDSVRIENLPYAGGQLTTTLERKGRSD